VIKWDSSPHPKNMKITRLTGVHCCGNICIDTPVWPAHQFQWSATQWVDVIGESVGGNGGNTSYTLARLDVPVRLHGMIGKDSQGEHVLSILRDAGVDTSQIRRSNQPTTATVCLVHPNADRMFFQRPGASNDVDPENLELSADPPFSHFHLANLFSLPRVRVGAGELLRRAREAGLTTSLDTGWDASGGWMDYVGPCLPHTDVFFVNDAEGRMLTGTDDPDEMVERLRRSGGTDVLLKLGARGCILFSGSKRIDVPGYAVKAVDTTGAGDSFAAGFFAGLFRGMPYPAALRLGNAVGALNVQKVGAVGGVSSWSETIAWMSEQSPLH
jgi:sugar/nucleoside kinase (ribokinase family)